MTEPQIFNKEVFFNEVRTRLYGGKLSQPQVDGLTYIMREWRRRHGYGGDHRWTAYALATTYHETAFTMLPITEYGSQKYLRGKKYYPYIGRGYVQLTWKENYRKAGREVDEDLVAFPDKALIPSIAAEIMFTGMTEGWFTNKKFADYFNEKKDDPVNARRIINGTDCAAKIATYHKDFLHAIKEGLKG